MRKLTRNFLTMTLALVCAAMASLPFAALPVRAAPAPATALADTKNYQAIFASAARGTTTSSSFLTYDATVVTAWLTVTAKSAGATSLDVKFQDSVDGTAFADMPGGAFTQVTASTAAQRITIQAPPGRYVQCVATVGGSSTPTFTFHVEAMFQQASGAFTASSAADASTLTGTLATVRLGEDVFRSTTVTVTTAQVLALNTTPITLVAAPGAGKILQVIEVTAKLVFNSVAYTGSNALEFRYTDGSGAKVTADIASTFINTASGTAYASVKGVVTALTPVANAPIVVFVPTANPAAGNSAIVFTVSYRVITP